MESNYLMEKHIEDWLEKYNLGEPVKWDTEEADRLKLWMDFQNYKRIKDIQEMVKIIMLRGMSAMSVKGDMKIEM